MKRERSNNPSVRQRKVASFLQKRISELLASGFVEGLSGLVTIMRVEVTANLRDAMVWISVFNQDQEAALAIIKKHVYELQGELYRDSSMRITPKVHFRLDVSAEHAGRIAELLEDIHHEHEDE